MAKKLFLFVMALVIFIPMTKLYADPLPVPLTMLDPIEDPSDNNGHHRTPMPVLYLDSHTLTASSNTVGSTVELLDENGDVVFSTYIYIEGDINLPTTLSGTYTIEVTRGGITFYGEIELE